MPPEPAGHARPVFAWDSWLGKEEDGRGILIQRPSYPPFSFRAWARHHRRITVFGLFRTADLIADLGTQKLGHDCYLTFILPNRDSLDAYAALEGERVEQVRKHYDFLYCRICNFLARGPVKGGCLEYPGTFPVEAMLFDRQFLAFRWLGRAPEQDMLQLDENDVLFRNVAEELEEIERRSRPVMQFNVHGTSAGGRFTYGGIVPHQLWRTDVPEDRTYLVSLCVIRCGMKLVLQIRSEKNAGCDLKRISLISEKVTESDFLNCSDVPLRDRNAFWKRAARAWRRIGGAGCDFRAVSSHFGRLIAPVTGERALPLLPMAAKAAMRRGLYHELNLVVDDRRLAVALGKFERVIYKEDGFCLFVFLYQLRITPSEFAACRRHDPSLRAFTVNQLKGNPSVNDFIHANLDFIHNLLLHKRWP